MCKAMESEGSGSNVGKGGPPGQVAWPGARVQPVSTTTTTAWQGGQALAPLQIEGAAAVSQISGQLETVGEAVSASSSAAAVDAAQQQQQQQAALLSQQLVESSSHQSMDLLYRQSSSSAAGASEYTSHAASLQEAMQAMREQEPAAAHDASSRGQAMQPPAVQAQQQTQPSQQEDDPGGGPATLFFAKVPRSATREQIEALFASFGEVVSLNLFAPFEGSPSSKGCGLVIMRSYADAASAISGLDNYKWEGMHSAMVVKLMPPQRQRHEQTQGQSHQQRQQLEGPGSGASSSGRHVPAQGSRMGPASSAASRSGYGSAGHARFVMGVDVPPAGCAPDAYKLFVGNIPRSYSEPDLVPVFESIGPVRELVVLRDRHTQESKGSAFVWYATGADADKAQLHFNMQLVLQQRSGASSRPLVVRRAAPTSQSQPGMAGLASGPLAVGAYPQGQGQQAYAMAMQQGPLLGTPADPGYVPVAVSGPQAVAAPEAAGMSQLALAYAPVSLPVTAGIATPQVYYDSAAGAVTVVPYQQQQQQHTPQQQQQQQQLWQQQQQQQQLPGAGPSSVPHCQGPPSAQFAAPVLLTVSEGFPHHVMQVQQSSWHQSQQQQPQQQPAYVTGYELSQLQGPLPVSGPVAYAPVEYAAQGQAGMPPVIVTSMPQAIPAAGVGQQAPQALAGGSLPSAGSNVLLSGSAGSSGSSNVGPLATYQQLGSQHHSLSIPLSNDQLNLINSQLGSVAAMSGTSITAEHNYACGSLALTVIAGGRQQLTTAWHLIQGLLGHQGGSAPQAIEGLM